MAAAMDRLRARHRRRRRAIAASRTSPGTSTTSPSGSSSGSRSRTCSTPSICKANLNPGTLRDVLSLRMGSSVAGTIRARVKDARLAQMLDHFTQYVGSSPYGSPAVLCSIAHMQTAEGVWYPIGGTRAVAEALRAAGERARLRVAAPARRSPACGSSATPCGRPDGGRRDRAGRRRGLEHGRDPHLPRAGRRRRGAALRAQGLRARLLGRGALSRASTGATSTSRTTTSSSRATPRRSSTGSTSAASRHPIPTCYLAAPSATEPGVAPRGRRGALRAGPHALPAAAPRLDRDAPGLPPGDPRQAEAHRGPARPRGAHRGRAAPDAAGHPRALQGAERRHLRPRQPRHVHRRLQARQPQPARQGPLPRRRRRPPGPGHADGDDVGLDRRRRAGRGRPRRGLCGGRREPASRRPSAAGARPRRCGLHGRSGSSASSAAT